MPDPPGPTEVVRHPLLRAVARAGLVAYGVVHVLIAALAVQVALGDPERIDKKGALTEIAETAAGVVLLWATAVGLAALVVWRLTEAATAHRRGSTRERVLGTAVDLGEAALAGVLAWTAGSMAAKGGAPSSQPPFAAVVLGLPGGPLLVVLAGVVVLAGAVVAVRRGVRRLFLRELDLRGAGPARTRLVTRVGQVGWIALGLVYLVPGTLLVIAGMRADPAQPTGIDAGLQALADEPWGPALLGLVAVGLVAFGAYCLLEARYRAD